MIDDEGTLSTTDVKARFVNGKPQAIEAKYSMRSQFEWDRFIRFMDRWGGWFHSYEFEEYLVIKQLPDQRTALTSQPETALCEGGRVGILAAVSAP